MEKPKRGGQIGNRGGRPEKIIDWELAARLASIHCKHEEIAWMLQVDLDTLQRRSKKANGVSFADFVDQKRGLGKVGLRRAMWNKALETKDNTMLIWLSKQHLGMTDKVESKQEIKTVEKVYVAEWGGSHEGSQSDDIDK